MITDACKINYFQRYFSLVFVRSMCVWVVGGLVMVVAIIVLPICQPTHQPSPPPTLSLTYLPTLFLLCQHFFDQLCKNMLCYITLYLFVLVQTFSPQIRTVCITSSDLGSRFLLWEQKDKRYSEWKTFTRPFESLKLSKWLHQAYFFLVTLVET